MPSPSATTSFSTESKRAESARRTGVAAANLAVWHAATARDHHCLG